MLPRLWSRTTEEVTPSATNGDSSGGSHLVGVAVARARGDHPRTSEESVNRS